MNSSILKPKVFQTVASAIEISRPVNLPKALRALDVPLQDMTLNTGLNRPKFSTGKPIVTLKRSPAVSTCGSRSGMAPAQ